MLIEQITKFQLRGSGSPVRTCDPLTSNFYDTIKSLSGLLFTAKLLQEAMYLTSPCLGQITKFNSKFKHLKVFWT